MTGFAIIISNSLQKNICEQINLYPLENSTFDDVVFITSPYPRFDEKEVRRLKLAYGSWLSSSSRTKIIILVDKDMFDPNDILTNYLEDIYGKGRIIYSTSKVGTFNKVPYIRDWFKKGVNMSFGRVVCFINSDIVLSSVWMNKIDRVFRTMKDDPLVITSQRIDFNLDKNMFSRLDFRSPNFLISVDDMVQDSFPEVHSSHGMDLFVFRSDRLPFNPDNIPPFLVGRYAWDNWLLGYLHKRCSVVSFGVDTPVYHINHRRHYRNSSDSMILLNDLLKSIAGKYYSTNDQTKYYLKDNYIYSREFPKKKRLLDTLK